MLALQHEMAELQSSLRTLAADFQRDIQQTLQQAAAALPQPSAATKVHSSAGKPAQ
jgi:cell division protein ZapA (FtsZ GTPase activity inhibitor)